MWDVQELRVIADRGFEALNIKPAENMVAQFCTHAYGSPYLLQQFCQRICENHGITERSEEPRAIGLTTRQSSRYESFFQEFAEGSNSDVRRIVAEFRSPRESKLKRYPMNGGEEANIYQLVLQALRALLPKQEIAAGDVVRQIETMVDGDGPENSEVTRALKALGELAGRIAEEERIGQAVIEWDERLRKIHITDASFAFHVKWGPI